jgi:ribosomal protein L7Ae-like RNA K-turn-binding protein
MSNRVARSCRPIAESRLMNEQSRQRIMRLLGLGVRARNAVIGVEQVRESAKRNKIVYAVVASDASKNSLDKLVPLLNARRVRFIEVPSAAELGAAVGRQTTAVVGIVDRQLAAGVRKLAESSQQGSEEDV